MSSRPKGQTRIQVMVVVHITAGGVALVAGFLALFAKKGGKAHRLFGNIFFAAMVVMTLTAMVVAIFVSKNPGNIAIGALTFYLVTTSWLTVRYPLADYRRWLVGLVVWASLASLAAFYLGYIASQSPAGKIGTIGAGPLFMFGTVGAIGILLDARLLRARHIAGVSRLIRHLWRMTYAMFVATGSFFLGQAKLFPQPIRESGVLAIPVLIVLLAFVYWLVKYARRAWVQRPRLARS